MQVADMHVRTHVMTSYELSNDANLKLQLKILLVGDLRLV